MCTSILYFVNLLIITYFLVYFHQFYTFAMKWTASCTIILEHPKNNLPFHSVIKLTMIFTLIALMDKEKILSLHTFKESRICCFYFEQLPQLWKSHFSSK